MNRARSRGRDEGKMEDKDLKKFISRVMETDESAPDLLHTLEGFRWYMTLYHCAIREVQTKFEVLNEELSLGNVRNPIDHIESRVKSAESIVGKLRRMGCKFSLQSMTENLNDIAGIRVICQYVDDIYTVAKMLGNQDDIEIIRIKDYIKNPKPNGYRSYHMIVEVPVFFSSKKHFVRVEVQFRTIAMDFWASLEHDIRYKKEIENPELLAADLKECADIASSLDTRMQMLRDRIRPKASAAQVEKLAEKTEEMQQQGAERTA